MSLQQRAPFEINEAIFATQQQRFTNYCIDYVIRFLTMIILMMGVLMYASITENEELTRTVESMSYVTEMIVSSIFVLLYYNVMEMSFGVTIGKLVTGTVVVDQYGNKPSLRDLSVRSICRLIPFNAFSFLGIPSRGWHDRLSATYVVQYKLLVEQKEIYESLDQIGQEKP